MKRVILLFSTMGILAGCGKKGGSDPPITPTPKAPILKSAFVDNVSLDNIPSGVRLQPAVRLNFSEPLKAASLSSSVSLSDVNGVSVSASVSLAGGDSAILVQPSATLNGLSRYYVRVETTLMSKSDGSLAARVSKGFNTQIDSVRKFPVISDDSLLTWVQKQTFKYFWDFGHPVSGLARERNASPNVVTTGGSGFGIMSIPVAINRNFISRADGLARLKKIVAFLKTTPPRFHGAFSHWMDGTTGVVQPFASNDDGADLVETSFLMMGLLTARQYFNGSDADEVSLRSDINELWNAVEWDWFRQNGKNVLYWNWSPNFGWAVNVPVQGWNETLVTYVLAASSPTHPVAKPVYDSGYARNGAMVNGASYYGYTLPLGPAYGGPLFFEHYSFLGIDPNGLQDGYGNYGTQTQNHSLINYEYCKANPKSWYGYSDSCWGLTASDIPNGYTASSPTNDVGVIAPTAAISSLPYSTTESMKALKFFYYVLGDKIWKDYGFVDAFSLKELWFADSFLAIDQGPQIVMIENHRTKLLWDLFMSCPEVKTGMTALGFTSPRL